MDSSLQPCAVPVCPVPSPCSHAQAPSSRRWPLTVSRTALSRACSTRQQLACKSIVCSDVGMPSDLQQTFYNDEFLTFVEDGLRFSPLFIYFKIFLSDLKTKWRRKLEKSELVESCQTTCSTTFSLTTLFHYGD